MPGCPPGTRVDEIADGIFRISTASAAIPGGFTFNQFLIVDDEPLLFHTGMRSTFPAVSAAIATVLPIERLRHIAFSHVEADECGALNELLARAPRAVPVCSRTAAMVSVGDLADRPPRALADAETLSLGRHTVEWIDTPHLPHGWESGFLFERTTATLFCGDLFTQPGADVPPVTTEDILAPSEAMRRSLPYFSNGPGAGPLLEKLAARAPQLLATMHGSSFRGDGAALLRALGAALAG